MKKQFWKNKKWICGISIVGVILAGILLFQLGGSNSSIEGKDTGTEIQNESIKVLEETTDETEGVSIESTISEEESTIDLDITQSEEPVDSETLLEKADEESSTTDEEEEVKEKSKIDNNTDKETVATVAEVITNHVPIAAGWKVEDSAKGDITSSQKAKLDAMITSWKAGELSDSELKTMIMNYLDDQGIEYMEVSVTSDGYALYDEIPEIDLRDGGNLYSYVGTYSTGEQNPDGTEKTVCYNWSAFVF